MSNKLNLQQQVSKLVFDCKQATQIINGTYYFNGALSSFRQHEFRVNQISMPFSSYNITDFYENNVMTLTFAVGGAQTITIPDGFYVLPDLFLVIHNLFLALTYDVTFSLQSYTSKVLITVVGNTITLPNINPTNPPSYLLNALGFITNRTTTSATQLANQIPVILQTNIIVYSNIVEQGAVNTKTQQVMANVPISGNFGAMISYQPFEPKFQQAAGNEALQSISFKFEDVFGYDIQFNSIFPIIDMDVLEYND